MAEINSTVAPSGKFACPVALSAFEHLLTVGALTETTRYDEQRGTGALQTDERGLEWLEGQIESLVTHVESGGAAIGHLMASVDAMEVAESLNDLGWLLCGLNRLSLQLHDRLGKVRDDLASRPTLSIGRPLAKAARASRSPDVPKVTVPAPVGDETRDIPFVSHWKQGDVEGSNHWDIVTTGRWSEDCALGSYYADEYLRYLQDHSDVGDQGLLCWIADDMAKNDPSDASARGVRVGFWGRLAELIEEAAQARRSGTAGYIADPDFDPARSPVESAS